MTPIKVDKQPAQQIDFRENGAQRDIVVRIDPWTNADLLTGPFREIQEAFPHLTFHIDNGIQSQPVSSEPATVNTMETSQHRGGWSID